MESAPHILMMIESSRESGRQLIAGVANYARHFGPWHFHWTPQGLMPSARPMEAFHFDGILGRDVSEVQSFFEAGIPTVVFSYSREYMDGAGWIDTDSRRISQVIAEHFLQRGFKNFAYCGYDGLPWSMGRGEGFAEILGESGFKVDTFWVSSSSSTDLDDNTLVQWLSSLPRPVALMAANDDLGQKVVHLCREAGLQVPRDCAVVGVDNDPVVCGLSNPPLSSVSLDQYQSGYSAAALLDKMMKGIAPDNLIITAGVGELEVRQSSDIIAVDDEHVTKALRFIQENSHRSLHVDEIALASGIYRRGLERRFSQHLSQTIQKYCRTIRAEHIEKVLRESHLSLEEIAEQCGFSQASHLTRFFSSVRGETPSACRKRISGLSF